MQRLRVTLFGRATIHSWDGLPIELPAKSQELLCYLLVHHSRPHTRESLACTLWAEASAAQARKYLRQSLWQLQQVVDATGGPRQPVLHIDRAWVGVHPDAPLEVDAQQLDRVFALVRDVDTAALGPCYTEAAAAAELYQGDLMTGWYQEWCLIARERYQSICFVLLDRLMEHCLEHRMFERGIAYGLRLLHMDHTRERAHRRLMALYSAAGDRTAAMRQFHICAAALEREFGVRPTERTVRLYEHIRAGRAEPFESHPQTSPTWDASPDVLAKLVSELANIRAYVAALHGDIEQIKRALRQETP